jgi:hypothetical protein
MMQIADLLAQHCLNIKALSLTENKGNSYLRLIVNDTDKAKQLLETQGFQVTLKEVIVIEVPDKPGGLAGVLHSVQDINMKVEFLSAFTQKSGEQGLIILRFSDLEAALAALDAAGIRQLSSEELYAM